MRQMIAFVDCNESQANLGDRGLSRTQKSLGRSILEAS